MGILRNLKSRLGIGNAPNPLRLTARITFSDPQSCRVCGYHGPGWIEFQIKDTSESNASYLEFDPFGEALLKESIHSHYYCPECGTGRIFFVESREERAKHIEALRIYLGLGETGE